MKASSALFIVSFFVGFLNPLGALAANPGIIDDAALKAKFQRGLESLYNAKKGTPLRSLMQQLKKPKARVLLPRARGVRLPPGKIYENCRPSVLMIGRLYKCGKCSNWHVSSASGFAITETGVIATNHHVVENNDGVALGAMDYTGRTYVVSEVLAANKADDVAILQLRDAKLTPLPLAAKAPVGTPVNVISHPDGRYFTMTKGDVSRYFVARSKSGGGAERMAITADYAKGSSGAPVLDDTGAVVGMVSATNSIYYNQVRGHKENLQMVVKSCIPVDAIWKLLR
ncbi:MAG: serine protease [Opitutales bacterium]